MAKGFEDAAKYEVSTDFNTGSLGKQGLHPLWAQPKFFTLSNITPYNAAY